MQRNELAALLESHHIPLHEWGTGEALTLDKLLEEVETGEARIVAEGGSLIRHVEGAVVTAYHTTASGSLLVLVETKQVFRDGRTRRRNLTTSIGEKMKPGESPLEAAQRAISEELGIYETLPFISRPPLVKGPVPSQSYPGLLTRYLMHAYEVFIPAYLFVPEGYVEREDDKTSFFEWRGVPHATG